MESNKRAIVITGGSLVEAITSDDLGRFDVLIAADSGVDAAHGLGLDPDVVVGDFDSVTQAALDYARRAGAMVIPASRDKDFTDTELAIDHAASLGASHITVVSSGGGRLDHTLTPDLRENRFAAAGKLGGAGRGGGSRYRATRPDVSGPASPGAWPV